MKNFSDTIVKKIRTHRLFPICPENHGVCEIIRRKYGTARQATDENMAHAHCMLDTSNYKHTLRVCNDYGFSNATMFAQARLHVTL
jgi:hypothetical protein